MIRLSIAVVLIVIAASACSNCGGTGRPCASSGDCLSSEVCLTGADGSSTCVPAEGEGEGNVGEGEGVAGEGEGVGGEGEGEGVAGEGEGEGAGPACGDGVVNGADEQCDDAHGNDNRPEEHTP